MRVVSGTAASHALLVEVDMAKTWDGKFSNLKISEQAFPELFRELESLHHKERSDRLRSLAMLGLYSLHFMGQNREGSPALVPQPSPQESEPHSDTGHTPRLKEAQNELKGRLLGSV